MIIAWPLITNPSDNYLECNGQAIDSKKYPKLYKLMKNTPDYRGLFLRGLGSQTYSQLNGTLNGITATTYTSGDLNNIQGDSIRNIYGELPDRNSYYMWTGVFSFNVQKPEENGATLTEGGYRGIFDTSRVVPTANENRPINKAVRYFIKAK